MLINKPGFQGVVCTGWGITTRMVRGVEYLSVQERYQKEDVPYDSKYPLFSFGRGMMEIACNQTIYIPIFQYSC